MLGMERVSSVCGMESGISLVIVRVGLLYYGNIIDLCC